MLYKMVVGFCKRANILWPNSTNWLKVFFLLKQIGKCIGHIFHHFRLFDSSRNSIGEGRMQLSNTGRTIVCSGHFKCMRCILKSNSKEFFFFFANKIEVQTERSILIWCNHARKAWIDVGVAFRIRTHISIFCNLHYHAISLGTQTKSDSFYFILG